ncbi:hypothetical protein P3G55_04505 [Leptospira sp. 96542]|nr:hypothetical protein [Leptospira sp. 96542]
MKAVEETPFAKKWIAKITSHPKIKEVSKWFAAKFGKKVDEVGKTSSKILLNNSKQYRKSLNTQNSSVL